MAVRPEPTARPEPAGRADPARRPAPAERSELVARYFVPTPVRPSIVPEIVTLAAGLVCVVIGYAVLTTPGLGSLIDGPAALIMLAGLVIATAAATHGVAKLLRHRAALGRALPKATGAQFDRWLSGAVAQAVAGAGPHPDGTGQPLIFIGIPDLARYPWNQLAAGADDQVLRFSLYEILVVLRSEHRLTTYAEVHDVRTGERRSPVITDFPLAAVEGWRAVDHPVGQGGGATALGQAVDRTAFAAVSEVARVRRLELSAGGRVAVTLTVGVATRRRGEPEPVAGNLHGGGGRLDADIAALNARPVTSRRPSQHAAP
jgi:hypothetical protein